MRPVSRKTVLHMAPEYQLSELYPVKRLNETMNAKH